jgi:hypothetical protein
MRDEFPQSVKDLLARRAAMRCSNPKCRQPTSGPCSDPSKATNVGVAAHITGAAPGGPRYDNCMSPEERSHPVNGIWLCQKCAKLVDDDPGKYTLCLLRQWREMAEVAASAELESGPQRPAKTQINAAVVIQGPNAINISGTNAVNIAPGGININGPIVRKD